MYITWKKDGSGGWYGYIGDMSRPRFRIEGVTRAGERGWSAYDLLSSRSIDKRYFGLLRVAKNYCNTVLSNCS